MDVQRIQRKVAALLSPASRGSKDERGPSLDNAESKPVLRSPWGSVGQRKVIEHYSKRTRARSCRAPAPMLGENEKRYRAPNRSI